jgi:hypothetical protein
LDGSVDWEKGVVGDAMLADVLAPPSVTCGKLVESLGGAWFDGWEDAVG